ncbi:MAG: transcriptional regulator [Roseburia sp.]|nr:transcriptional regulator [Roseburia sp.]
MKKKLLKVRMLGAFTMEYEGRSIAFERNTQTKTNQLLQILFHAGEAGINREEIMRRLFGREEVTNPSNSLRATVFRLRKLLLAAGISEDDEFVHIKSGIYRFTSAIPVELDTVLFEEAAQEALSATEEAARCKKLQYACALYQGDFLPQIEEEWTLAEATKYKELYVRCMSELCELLKKRGEYELLFQTAAEAVELYPYDEWQVWQLDSLIVQNQMKEAMHLYEETADELFRKKGISPSEKLTERLAQMSGSDVCRVKVIEEIQEELGENRELDGAFYCSYPSFAETYRYIKRVIERSGQSAYLMLCTVTDGKGYPLEKGERVERLSDELGEAIQSALRRGDLYTKYSVNQYLVLLLDIKHEDCQIVIDRINDRFENPYRKNYLKYSIKKIRK